MIPTFKTLHIGGVEGGRENIKRGYLIQKKDFRRLGEILHLITFFFPNAHIITWSERTKTDGANYEFSGAHW